MENLHQSLDELRVKQILRWLKRVFRAVPEWAWATRLRWWRSYGYGPLVNQNVFSWVASDRNQSLPLTVIANLRGFQPCHADINRRAALAALDMAIACESKSGLMVCPSQVVTVVPSHASAPGAARLFPDVRHPNLADLISTITV